MYLKTAVWVVNSVDRDQMIYGVCSKSALIK